MLECSLCYGVFSEKLRLWERFLSRCLQYWKRFLFCVVYGMMIFLWIERFLLFSIRLMLMDMWVLRLEQVGQVLKGVLKEKVCGLILVSVSVCLFGQVSFLENVCYVLLFLLLMQLICIMLFVSLRVVLMELVMCLRMLFDVMRWLMIMVMLCLQFFLSFGGLVSWMSLLLMIVCEQFLVLSLWNRLMNLFFFCEMIGVIIWQWVCLGSFMSWLVICCIVWCWICFLYLGQCGMLMCVQSRCMQLQILVIVLMVDCGLWFVDFWLIEIVGFRFLMKLMFG